jgi:hypothetical protein
VSLNFACHACGSPSIALPAVLDEDAFVRCGHCHAKIDRWGAFKARTRAHFPHPVGVPRPPAGGALPLGPAAGPVRSPES